MKTLNAATVWLTGAMLGLGSSGEAFGLAAHRNYLGGTGDQTWIVVALGDSIAAGFCGFDCTQDSYVQFYSHLNPESASSAHRVKIDGRIRATSGLRVGQIRDDLKNNEADLKEADIITLDACGNDYLQARGRFRDKRGKDHCNAGVLKEAVKACRQGMDDILEQLRHTAKPSARIRVMNIYYPGYDVDSSQKCGALTHADLLLPEIVEGNWHTCEAAYKRGIPCADAFAEMNSADIDTDGDGTIDKVQLAYIPGESLESYRTRVVITHRALVHDAQKKTVEDGSIHSLLIGDNTHPNAEGHARLGTRHHDLGY